MTAASPRRRLGVSAALLLASVVTLTAGAALADDPNARPWLAQTQGAAPAPAAAPEPSSRLSWRASLLVLVSAGLGGAAVWARGRKGKMGLLTSSRDLRVISSVRVGAKGHLVLAGVGDRAILLGVTDESVRRLAWLPADQLTTVVPAETADSQVTTTAASPTAPRANAALRGAKTSDDGAHLIPMHKGGFAEILRKLGNRPVDAPPSDDGNAATAALAIADMRGEDVEWSRGASSVRGTPKNAVNGGATSRAHESSPPPRGAKRHEGGAGDMEQQAAGILKRRSRSRS